MGLNAIDKIRKARVGLQRNNPFFAYLSLQLKPQEMKSIPTMAIDINANLYYNAEFVENMSDEEVTGVLIHEILHITLLHFLRTGERNKQISNIAQDIVINYLIKENNFHLPEGCIWVNNQNETTIMGKVIKDVDKKVWEEIYDELYNSMKEQLKEMIKSGKAQIGNGEGEGIEIDLDDYEFEGSTNEGYGDSKIGKVTNVDTHIRGNGNKPISEEERKAKEKEWLGKVQEAYIGSKMSGKVPVGIERLIGQLHESKIDWKSLLLRYIESYVPSDYTYAKCSKKSMSSGYYMPDTIKDRIDVSVLIDVSGSIGNEELNDFVSEIVAMARAFRNKIKFSLYTHETNLGDKYIVENGSVQKIKQIKIKGGGGTSFSIPYNELTKNNKPKVVVWLTDGYGDTIQKKDLKSDIIWVLSKNSTDVEVKEIGRVIKLK